MTCSHCGGTFYPESIDQIATHQAIRYGLLRESERWHMTEALMADLADRLDIELAHESGLPNATSVYGIPRCEHDLFT